MSLNLERRVNLGRAARGVYAYGLPLDQACPEIDAMQLSEADVVKIDRGIHIAKASDDMANKMALMRDQFPPYGLVRLKDPSVWNPLDRINFETEFEAVKIYPELETRNPSLKVPGNYAQILGAVTESLRTTMLYALLYEAKANNTAIAELPHVVDPLFGDPVLDINRGVGTGSQVMINVLHTILLEYQLQTGLLPTFGEFRGIAMGSTDIVLLLSDLNSDIAQKFPVFFNENFTDKAALEMFRLSLNKRKLEFAQPYYDNQVFSKDFPYPINVTTGCPARVQMQSGKPSSTLRVWHQLIDIVA